MHGDVKPENFVLFNSLVAPCKLGDYDTCTSYGKAMLLSQSYENTAPEVFEHLDSPVDRKSKLEQEIAQATKNGEWSKVAALAGQLEALKDSAPVGPLLASSEIDMWSIGVFILYVMIAPLGFRDLPSDENTRKEMVADGSYVQSLVKHVTIDSARRILYDKGATGDLLCKDPKMRMSMANLMKNRSFITGSVTGTSMVGAIKRSNEKVTKEAVADIADHIESVAIKTSDRTVEKVTEEIRK